MTNFLKVSFLMGILCFSVAFNNYAQTKNPEILELWYNQPSKDWNEALPIENGRLGVVIFGTADKELIQLNEAALWTGGPVNSNPNPTAFPYLAQVCSALFSDSVPKTTSKPITLNQQKFYSLTFETVKGKKYSIIKS